MRMMLVAVLAAALLAAVPSVAASGDNAYSVTINGSCTTVDQSTWTDGQPVAIIHIRGDTFVTNVGPLNRWINEAGYFWWLSDVHQPLPPPPEVPADSPLINSSSIKVYVAHGACGSSATTTTTTATTTTATVVKKPPQQDYFCASKYSKRPLLAVVDKVVRRLLSKTAFAPYWVADRKAGKVNIGKGHLACAIPKGMARDGVFRDSHGKVLPRKRSLAHQPGAYPEVRKR
jgi:hypothetical protein